MSPIKPTIRAVENLLVRLRDARKSAYEYLQGFLPEDLDLLMETIDQELECLDPWDYDKDKPEFGYSGVELLRQLDLHAGTFIFEGAKHYEINVIEIFATFAFAKASDGIGLLEGNPNFDDYTTAAEHCTDAFAALHYGNQVSRRAEPLVRLSKRALSGAKGKSKRLQENEVPFIIKEFEKIQNSGDAIITGNIASCGKEKNYKVRKGGKINIEACARYIYDYFNYKLECEFGFIRGTIKKHLADNDDVSEPRNKIIVENIVNEEDERNRYPQKYVSTSSVDDIMEE